MKSPSLLLALICFLAIIAGPQPAHAHAGPPILLTQDESAGPYLISLWSDPDIGRGVFIIEAKVPDQEFPPGTTATLWIKPDDGHLEEAGYAAGQDGRRDEGRFVAIVPLDATGVWSGRVVLDGMAGRGEVNYSVDVVEPSAARRWLVYPLMMLPFMMIGVLWLINSRLQRDAVTVSSNEPATPSTDSETP